MSDFPTRLSVAEAQACVLALAEARRLPAEAVALDVALGRFVAAELVAPFDMPPFANSAMDGYALRAADLPMTGDVRLRVTGALLAGASAAPRVESGTSLRITTGAPLPDGADSVVVKENVRLEGDDVVIRAGELAGANVRPAGEDYRRGDVALRNGDRLTPARLGVLAACGQTHATVSRLPRVALFVTGDELIAPGQALGFGQIHDSNRYSLRCMLQEVGIEPVVVAHLRDDPAMLREALHDAGQRCDLIISSGGVSAGEADFMPGIVADLGKIHFWKVRMKPGMPVLFGEVGNALMFGLPGNPVSTIATFLALVKPALLALQGASTPRPRILKARLAVAIRKTHDRAEFLRADVESRDDGAMWATALVKQGSGMLRGVADADALIVVPEATKALAIGDVIEVLLLGSRT